MTPPLPFTAWVFGIRALQADRRIPPRKKRRAAVPLEEAGDPFGHDDTEEAIARAAT